MRVSLEAVTKKYKKVKALDGVSLSIDPGQVVAVLGPNGAGKTTMLLSLAGVLRPTSGQILYDGERFTRDRMDMRLRFFLLPDFPSLFANMTVARHIGMVLRLYKGVRDGMAEEVVEILRGLEILPLVDTKLAALSRGQVYKTALAALMAVNPELWLLDEPFASGMDPAGISFFKKRALEAAKSGRTILYTTQILDVAERFSDRACLLHHGQVHTYEAMTELHRRVGSGSGALEEVFAKLSEN
jgi:ABC-type multidrug transport system ATPase subunit